VAPKSEGRSAGGWRRLWLVLLALAIATPGATVLTASAAHGERQDPTGLWSEYPLDPTAGATPTSPPAESRASRQRPARAASEAGAPGQELVPADEEASKVWALALLLITGLALAGMAGLTPLVRKKSAAATNGGTGTEKPPAVAAGTRYGD
jgi:hypothetical protein